MTKIKRYDWADFMRGLMMFLVVLYHSEVYYFNQHTWSWVFEPFFLTGFFFVSGYLFTKDIAKVSLEAKVKQVVRGILFPYFFFVFLLALPKVAVGHSQIHQLLIDIFTLRASWFVITIAGLQIIYALLLRFRPSNQSLILSTIVMFVIGYGFVLMYRDCPDWVTGNPWLHSAELPNRLPLCINLTLVQSPFFALGILYRKYEERINHKLGSWGGGYLLTFSILFYVLGYIVFDHLYIHSSMCVVIDSYNNFWLVYVYAVSSIWALINISKCVKTWKPLNYIGKYSILFYFLNGGALTIVSALMRKLTFMDPGNYLNQIVVAILATALMFPCVWFINKYLPILSGNKDIFNKMSKRLGIKINW